MKGANDARPLMRRAATRVITLLLRLATGSRGTDTHGLDLMGPGCTVQGLVIHQWLRAITVWGNFTSDRASAVWRKGVSGKPSVFRAS